MTINRTPDQRARHWASWQMALRTGVAGLAVVSAQAAIANPSGGSVVAGQASINGQGTDRLRIDQASDRVVINWDNFSINQGQGVDFRQPNARAIALNRVTGPEISQIMGELTANGQVYLINGNGIVFGKDARVDVAGLVATSADIANDAFMAGGALRFGTPGRAGARIVNHGSITVRDAGMAAFVAPQVANDGIITAHMGRIAFGGAQAFTLDLHGDNLIRFQVGDAVQQLDEKGALVDIGGVVDSRGGSLLITASAARDLVNQSVRIGTQQAGAMEVGADGKVSLVAAKMTIAAPGEVAVGKNVALDLSSGTNSALDGGTGGSLTITAARTILDGTINLDGSKTGGTAHITGSDFLSFGSILSASGAEAGGNIQLDAGGFSLAGRITVNAGLGKGGTVDIHTTRRAIDTGDAFIDASGLHGGSIRYVSDQQIISSGKFRASGSHGFGGNIDVSAARLDLFSAQFYAQGGIRGGRVRLGGEFQGGKALSVDELLNANTLVATDAVTVDVSAIGTRGNGGEIVVWSDEKTTFLGTAIARGGVVGGTGGQVEISGKETLLYRGTVETARDGQRGGKLLLDPKNIVIAEGSNAPSQYGLVLQAFASSFPGPAAPPPGLEADDGFGSVSLDGNRLAVGVRSDDALANERGDTGAVYLFSFADAMFATPVLESIIGSGYSGGKNIAVGALESGDFFGHSVSLDGTRLAVGARDDDGEGNGAPNSGAVYLFAFDDLSFGNGNLLGVLGVGYSGLASLSVPNLGTGDLFGASVSLDGDRLAVGALFDDGVSNGTSDAGAAYLFSFTDSLFSNPSLEAIIGEGYTGGKNVSLALDANDYFGSGISLDNLQVAVGAEFDDGAGNVGFSTGAVYLFAFSSSTFDSGSLQSTIGLGYSGTNDFDLTSLDASDHFGSSVSLDGGRLAVVATLDDGAEGTATDSGVVYLFTYPNGLAAAPDLVSRIGANYGGSGGKSLSIAGFDVGDTLSGVSLNGNRLVIAVGNDDGRNNAFNDSGAVHLFTFDDAAFNNGRQIGTLGAGYTNVTGTSLIGTGLERNDGFGTSVSLDGNRLAVGAPFDDGASGDRLDVGAVYLFSFGDAQFSAPVLQSVIGSGYSGGKNLSIARLQGDDLFGYSVSLDGLRLAVGAIGDDGPNDALADGDAGAVYLFTFGSPAFDGGTLARVLDFESINGTVTAGSALLGTAVSLQGNTIAIGAAGDAGANGLLPDSGAVHLFDLGDPQFVATPDLLLTIGFGYDIDMPDVSSTDRFGTSVALDGLNLAIGAPGDDGFGDDFNNTGAVFLFTFGGSDFSGGSLAATLGAFYPGSNDFTPIGLGLGSFDNDFFGESVALQGLQLAVGAVGDDGADDTLQGGGAVYLFTFGGSGFSSITQTGIIGGDYIGPGDFALKLDADEGGTDTFGSAVAIDGNRLVVGASGDSGPRFNAPSAGAVHLFTFADGQFGGTRLIDTLGAGYSGTRNASVAGLAQDEAFGSGVSLDGLRLAVGVPGDTGAAGGLSGYGAVYLFSFADLAFNAPVLQGIIGQGYSGGKNLAVASLDPNDFFGWSVSLEGNRLAVGALGDDGVGNGAPTSGAVYLFTFSDALFSDPAQRALLSAGATGPNDINIANLEAGDFFGGAVSLDGLRLAVGAEGDDGIGSFVETGAVYLFSFVDADFTGGTTEAIIGSGYSGGKNIDVAALTDFDFFGTSVALAGNRLFIGAVGDDGASDSVGEAGAVYHYTFADAAFNGGNLQRTIGAGYFSGGDVNVSNLGLSDGFGTAVAFDAGTLAVGARGDSGINDGRDSAGAVYLFAPNDGGFSLSNIIGAGYTQFSDLPLGGLGEDDMFGTSVSLDLNRLVVGSVNDDGARDTASNAGAAYLFTFNENYNAPQFVGTIGVGYGAPQNVSTSPLGSTDGFGMSVSLQGNRLVIGEDGDTGASGTNSLSGAVYLFTFDDNGFTVPVLRGIIGQGYTGGNNFDVGSLESFDVFGKSVALDGLRLAVGAPGDDGANNDTTDAGAVYLFSFADASLTAPQLEARIGRDYAGASDISLGQVQAGDQFGASVGLLDLQLAIGAPGDDGASDTFVNAGAVYLISFADFDLTGGLLEGTFGRDYFGTKDLDIPRIGAGDGFGGSVSLAPTGLAVGAERDDGFADDRTDSGAVHLFTFDDTVFTSPALAGTIGFGYNVETRDLSFSDITAGELFGSSVALQGTLLAAGARGDNGAQDAITSAGAVFLFGFADTSFNSGGTLGVVGAGYTGGFAHSVPGLEAVDQFGASVSLDAGRLVVGAPGDDGSGDGNNFAGAVYLFTFGSDTLQDLTFAGVLGSGYASGPSSSLSASGLGDDDRLGVAVSLDGLQLAIGASQDDGVSDLTRNAGAVYLFSFADPAFGSPILEAVLGAGYSGGKNLSIDNLEQEDRFGSSVSLDGNRLAVGADGDDGALSSFFDVGAVYLFSFADTAFSAPTLQAIVGADYSGGSNVSLANLDFEDFFGRSVALQGTQLVVGAPGDDGSGVSTMDTGAVYLLTFATPTFDGGNLAGIVGRNYLGVNDIDVASLGDFDVFGVSVSLDAGRLVVGSPFDDGAADDRAESGAVRTFAFADDQFTGGSQISTIGFGYSGTNDFDLGLLDPFDEFGIGVSIEGTQLVVGAHQDAGLLNNVSAAGAVYLFTFGDATLNTPILQARIGAGYNGGNDINVPLDAIDTFGYSVALDSNRLAVGAILDNGPANLNDRTGAVYLFTFADSAFNGGVLEGTLGAGYRSQLGLDLAAGLAPTLVQVGGDDAFGQSVSLNGNRLAIGAQGDDGSIDGLSNAGAVYLFSFADASFGGANLEAVIGHGFVGGKNLWPTEIGSGDRFGSAVSLDGERLAVGAPGDDGNGTFNTDAGAVYLFSFLDSTFSGGSLEGIMGSGYIGGKNVDLTATVDVEDEFGASVSLSGVRLAIGAPGDDGRGNVSTGNGAVHLYTFSDLLFSDALLEGRIGEDYNVGIKDLDVDVIALDAFGSSVSLDGNSLVVGAAGDDGAVGGVSAAGAVYLFSFSLADFSGGNLIGNIGTAYTGPNDINVPGLEAGDRLGGAVSLNGTRLAVGAPGDDGLGNGTSESGAIYLFTFTNAVFAGALQEAVIGRDYSGGKNVGIAELESGDQLGVGVSLNGNRLIAGAVGDDGFGNGASSNNAGAVYLFTFGDGQFGGAGFAGNIGAGYTRGLTTPVNGMETFELFGWALSLDGDRLAIGSPQDTGVEGSGFAGAVYLFSFASSDLEGPTLEGVLGEGYTGGKNLDVPGLAPAAFFGGAVSLDGNRLAVGASNLNGGSVFLFTFADAAFTAPQLASLIAPGASGGNNLAVPAVAGDFFGYSVSLDGNRLAVGAPLDDGAGDSFSDSGAVYLFSFADAEFTGPVQEAIIGAGYTGGKNVSLAALEAGDHFGTGVSLQGLRLAVGAEYDDGAGNVDFDTGAAYLFAMSAPDFSSLTQVGIIGRDYSGAGNLNIDRLGSNDWFGRSLSLDGDRLVIGAVNDSGSADDQFSAGAVYLVGFADAAFGTPSLRSIIGHGYSGPNDVAVGSLDAFDFFGNGVTLDAGRLVIGAPYDDGPDNLLTESGAVYFFNLIGGTGDTPGFAFADNPGDDVTISASSLVDILSGGTGVTLQANNDITVNAAILVDNPSGDGGALGLYAGRSIFINAGITTDNGTVNIVANDLVANGVVDAFRDAGDAVVSFGAGGFIDAGTGFVGVGISSGNDHTFGQSGAISVGSITAGTIEIINAGSFGNTAVNIFSGAVLSASDAGNAIVVRSDVFTNLGGAGAFNLTGGGRFLVYSSDYDAIDRGGLVGNNLYNRFFPFDQPPTITQPGNLFLFSRQPVLTFTADDASRTYGEAAPGYTFQFAGLVNGDSDSYAFFGAPDLFDSASGNAGTDTIFINQGTLTSDVGYGFDFVNGALTTLRALLTAQADDQTREYGLANPAFTVTYSGFVNGDDESVILSNPIIGTLADTTSDVGTYSITLSDAFASNYDFDYVDGTLTITRALLTVTADDASREYGLANPAFTGSVTGFRNSDTTSVISGLTYDSDGLITSDVGTYNIFGAGASATNYDFDYIDGALTITRALLTVVADDATREYGLANPAFSGSVTGFRNSDDASLISGLTYDSDGLITSDVGSYSIFGSGASATNYNFDYVDGALTITRALLTVTADDATREYGLANPAFTGSVTGFRNSDDASVISGLTYDSDGLITSDVGTYNIFGAGASATNYDFDYVDGTLTITRALLTVTAEDATREYGLANPAFTGSVTGFRNSDDASVISGLTYDSDGLITSDVGSYSIFGSGASATNYDFDYVDGTLTITQALLTVTADDATREYGLANPTFSGSVSGFRNSDDASVISGLTYDSDGLITSDVGSYSIFGSGASATNYDFDYVDGTLTITQALLTVTADDATREYGLANPTFTGSVSGFRNSDTASVISGLVYGSAATTASNVGAFAITGSGASATNYDFDYVDGTLTITQALLTVTADDATREYGLANPTFTGSVSGFRNSDTASVISGLVYGSAATTASNVGAFAITGSGASATNYGFDYVDGTLTITRALLTVTADDATREYGLANPAFTGSVTGFRNSDDASVISGLTYDSDGLITSDVGSYSIFGSGASATNYDFDYVDGTLTITQALLTVTADDATREYGLANPTFTGSVSGFRNSDTTSVISGLTYDSDGLITSDVGTYTIFGSGASATNYDFAYAPGALTITRALLTVSADDVSREYGLANPALAATITGLRNGDAAGVVSGLVLATTATSASNVSDFAIGVSGGSALNYDFAYIPGTLSITKALLTVTIDDKTRIYGAPNPALTASIAGFRNGDTADVVTGLRLRTGALVRANVGDYLITGSGANAANYSFAYTPGTFTITKALLQVRVDNAAREYGLENPAFSSRITGFRNGDNASVVNGLVLSTSATIGSDVGTYAITASGASALNYDFTYTPGRLAIDQARLLITANSVATDQGSGDPVLTVSYSGLRNGDGADVVTGLVMRSSGGGIASPGQYIINASRGTARNYQITYRPGVMTVLPVVAPPTQDPPTQTPPITGASIFAVPPAPVETPPIETPPIETPTIVTPPVVMAPAVAPPVAPTPPTGAAPSPATPAGNTAAPDPVAPVSGQTEGPAPTVATITMPSQGSVSVPVPPAALSPVQLLQGMSSPLPVLVSPETQPKTAASPGNAPQGDGQEQGCQYISLCSAVARPLWTFQPVQ